jgi:hypothetical protein
MYIDIQDLAGTATYTNKLWNSNLNPAIHEPSESTSGTYSWAADHSNKLTLFINTKSGDTSNNDVRIITLTINSPSSNPLSSFDKAPFDLFLQSRFTEYWLYVYDPETGDHSEDNTLVSNSVLSNVYLNAAVVVPDLNWIPPSGTNKIWMHYPKFIDFARTYRTDEIKNRNWYETYVPNP